MRLATLISAILSALLCISPLALADTAQREVRADVPPVPAGTTDMTPVDTELYHVDKEGKRHSVLLTIPKAYFDHERFWKQRAQRVVFLKTEWHHMLPWSVIALNDKQADPRRGLLIVLKASIPNADWEQELSGRLDSLTPLDNGPSGLRHYVPITSGGSKKAIYSDVYIPLDNVPDNARYIECMNPRLRGAACHIWIYATTHDVLIDYMFQRDAFEHWREIDRKVIAFVQSLRTDKPKTNVTQ